MKLLRWAGWSKTVRNVCKALLVAAVLLIWIKSPQISEWISDDIGAKKIGDTGAGGDSFGAATSLFSALAFLGILFVLSADLRHRRASRVPFLYPKLSATTIIAEVHTQSYAKFVLVIHGRLQNFTSEPVINLRAAVQLFAPFEPGQIGRVKGVKPLATAEQSRVPQALGIGDVDSSGAKNGPLSVELSASFIDGMWLEVSCNEEPARVSIQALSESKCLRARVTFTYSNLENVVWESSLEYEISNVPQDVLALPSLRSAKELGFEETWKEVLVSTLRISVPDASNAARGGLGLTEVPNTWQHRRVR